LSRHLDKAFFLLSTSSPELGLELCNLSLDRGLIKRRDLGIEGADFFRQHAALDDWSNSYDFVDRLDDLLDFGPKREKSADASVAGIDWTNLMISR
jgi:hypothetical protein